MKRVKSSSLNQKLLDAIKKANGRFSEEAKKRYSKKDYYHSDHFDDVPNRGGRYVDEIHIDDPIIGKHPNYANNFSEWFNRYGDPFRHVNCRCTLEYEAEHESLLTMLGWSGIWNDLNTVQKMIVFRFVYKIENAEII
jgi:hypothetical protein